MQTRSRSTWRRTFLTPIVAGLLLVAGAGCPPQDRDPVVLEPPMALDEAMEALNANTVDLDGVLQARGGHAKGHFTDADGKKRTFDYDAALLLGPPRLMRFDLNALGTTYLLFGSNPERYWIAVKPEIDTIWWGRYDQPDPPRADDLTVRPDLIVQAFGLTPFDVSDSAARPFTEISGNRQTLLVYDVNDAGEPYVVRKYYISRARPHDIEQIVFFDADSNVLMDARLDDYVLVPEANARIPRLVDVTWPSSDGRLKFTTSSWRVLEGVDASHPGFAFPLERGEKYRRIVDIDTELDNRRRPPETKEFMVTEDELRRMLEEQQKYEENLSGEQGFEALGQEEDAAAPDSEEE